MTICPARERGVPDHEAKHVEVRFSVPWRPDGGPVRVEVVHRCEQWGCPNRLVEWTEPAIYPEKVLRKVLEPRGMMSKEGVPLTSSTTAWVVDLYGTVPPTATHVVLPIGALDTLRKERAERALRDLSHDGILPMMQPGAIDEVPGRGPQRYMDVVRDSPRPRVGQTTSDPDAFLRRVTVKRQAHCCDGGPGRCPHAEPDGRPYE